MLRIIGHRSGGGDAAESQMTLSFDERQRSRARVRLDDGRDAGLFLPRGAVLRDGDLLLTADGQHVGVKAAAESVSIALTNDPVLLARACYHLGNRHVRLQVGGGWIRYQYDHVLDDLVRALGLTLDTQSAPFEPETGAYHRHPHGHEHQQQPDA